VLPFGAVNSAHEFATHCPPVNETPFPFQEHDKVPLLV
jgi:hypothetical protein